jgi:hypothetical protein
MHNFFLAMAADKASTRLHPVTKLTEQDPKARDPCLPLSSTQERPLLSRKTKHIATSPRLAGHMQPKNLLLSFHMPDRHYQLLLSSSL